MKTTAIAALFSVLSAVSATAQQNTVRQEMVDFSEPEFVPHWQIGVQGGVAGDLGEAPMYKLLSPALQLTGEYRLHELFGIRASVSGFWARNRYVYPRKDYSWNFIQPAVEFKLDLASLFMGWVPDQTVSPYIFGGVGAACTFGNDDAEKANKENTKPNNSEFAKLWDSSRWHTSFRGGVGADIYISDVVSVGVEVNANLMPDHFNSKQGKHDNKDWHFNALLGVKFNLGKTYRGNNPVYRNVPVVAQREPVVRDTVALQVNIMFLINSSVLRQNQFDKLYQVLNYLNAHPKSHIEMTGYADRLTGTPTINERLSQERATAVANWLMQHGISQSRLYKDAKGDRVQPFPVNEDNRVTICFVVDMLD